MKIEDITPETIAKADKNELHSLRLRFNQLWSKHFEGCRKSAAGTLTRENLLQQYRILIKEIRKRKLTYYTKAIDRALFKKTMMGLDVPSLDDVVVVPNYVAVGGAFAKTAFDAEVVDIIIREDENNRDENLELKLSALVSKQTDKKCRFTYAPAELSGVHIPLFDQVLRAKTKTARTTGKEADTESAGTHRKSLDKWSDTSVAEFKTLLSFLKNKDRILEVGCGTGRLMALLSKYGYDVMGVDNNKTALKKAEQKDLDVRRVDLEKKLPFEDDEFDLVIGTHVIEHVENPALLISEAHRIAKRESLFVVSVGESDRAAHKHIYKRLNDLRVLFKHTAATAEWIRGSKSTALVAAKKSSNRNESSDTIVKTEERTEEDKMYEQKLTLKETLDARHDSLNPENYVLNKKLRLLPVKKDAVEHIVYGIVSEPETEDSQGDIISEAEIRKAAYRFMEEAQIFKVNHDGNEVKTSILENFLAPDDFVINGLPVKKGSWILAVRVLNKAVWEDITKGALTGYSIAGYAQREDS